MGFLVFIYFIILTFYEIKYLSSSGCEFESPLDRDQKMWFSGPETFWVIIFSTGIIALSARIGMDLMAIRLLVLELLCLFAIFKYSEYKCNWSFPLVLYLIYLVWVIIGCFYSPVPFYGIRVFLKYLYPLLIALTGSCIIRYFPVALKSMLWARKVSLISIVICAIPIINSFFAQIFPGVFWYSTALAINYQWMFIFSLALYFYTDEKKKNLRIALIFCLPCLLWVFRTSIMGTAIAVMIFMFFKYKLKSLPYIFGIFILFLIAVFSIPSVRNKMFYNSEGKSIEALQAGKISADDINSNGRFAMWEWSLDRFYDNKEMTGSGTGNLQETFYSLRHPFGGIKICHNDYVQILCDNGLIGIVLFGASFLLIIFHCFIVYSKTDNIGIKILAITSGASLAGMMLSMYTDNAINYTMATFSYPLGSYGMMLGLLKAEKE